jgi:hypothetical protein
MNTVHSWSHSRIMPNGLAHLPPELARLQTQNSIKLGKSRGAYPRRRRSGAADVGRLRVQNQVLAYSLPDGEGYCYYGQDAH